jgi:hypothetical protein
VSVTEQALAENRTGYSKGCGSKVSQATGRSSTGVRGKRGKMESAKNSLDRFSSRISKDAQEETNTVLKIHK